MQGAVTESERQDLISVIIPVYKVEKYLDQCLESVVGQTYRNLEILLVDDGSPDRCGAMCDAWAQRDGRIKVIHKANGGQSEARNAALDVMKGSYVMFVDSDDWIASDCVASLYRAVKEHDVPLAWGLMQEVDERGVALPGSNPDYSLLRTPDGAVVEGDELWNKYLIGSCHVMRRLYDVRIWQDLRFPVGKVFEDVCVWPDVLDRAKKIVALDKILYFYRFNSNSIMHSNFDCKKTMDYLDALCFINDVARLRCNYEVALAQKNSFCGIYSRLYSDMANSDLPGKAECLRAMRARRAQFSFSWQVFLASTWRQRKNILETSSALINLKSAERRLMDPINRELTAFFKLFKSKKG